VIGRRRERGVGMVEFALVAGLFFLLLMTLFDVGKGVYVKNTLDAEARDGARAAVILNLPTLTSIENAVHRHSPDIFFATPCPFDPPSPARLKDNQGAVFINAMPEGGKGLVDLSHCAAGEVPTTTASGNVPITVTIVYKYVPITPLVTQFIRGGLTFTSSSTMTTEY
jgi:hypothetical protein